MTPAWVGPTVAISLVVIATSFLVIGGVALAIGLGLRRETRRLKEKITAVTTDARAVTSRLKGELEAFADLSSDARRRITGAIDNVDRRLRDLDALVEVLQEEAEETALDVAALVRTVRRSGRVMMAARRAAARRRAGGEE
jgi:septal ring factor EnvC (AmiA/AmiB activator)